MKSTDNVCFMRQTLENRFFDEIIKISYKRIHIFYVCKYIYSYHLFHDRL